MCGGTHNTANLSIVCGPASGVFVLDRDGEQSLQSLLLCALPATPKVKTTSGCHYYFALPADAKFKNAVGVFPGCHTSDRRQVGAAPSRHTSVVKYVWDILPEQLARAGANIDIPYEGEIPPFAEAPDWPLEEMTHRTK